MTVNVAITRKLNKLRMRWAYIAFLLIYCSSLRVAAQTVIINEVSNGPSGNAEYMELVVVPDGPVEPCVIPLCLDLRNWMIDDNNGYHGGGGVAPGAVRFANNPLWSCVPVGTIIAIYNGGDPNPSLPANDMSLADGNCSIVVSAMDLAYFEFTNSTPAAVPCDYPGSWGLDPSPTWNGNMAFANTGDCARVADAAGCEVFSFCFGNTTQNATVAIAGQGADKVWYFSGGDPNDASNWITGCAGDIGSCGSDDQTPGAANNAANAAWLSSFNSGCNAVVPTLLDVTAVPQPACGCTGSASASAQGSTAPYTYVWYDAQWSPIGQATANATALCAGIYQVIGTSAAGCVDTATVDVPSVAPPDAGTGSPLTLCSTDQATDLFQLLGSTPDAGGTWTPSLANGSMFDPAVDVTGVYTYTVTATAPCVDASASITVAVSATPTLDITVTDLSCAMADDGTIEVDATPPSAYTFTWTGGLPATSTQQGLPPDTWSVVVENSDGCSAEGTATVSAPAALSLITSSTSTTCGSSDGEACAEANGGTGTVGYAWSDPQLQQTPCAGGLVPGPYTVTVTDENGCVAMANVTVVNDDPSITVATTIVSVDCAGGATGRISLAIQPVGDYTVQWAGPEGFTADGPIIEDLPTGTYGYTVTNNDGCALQGDAFVSEPDVLVLAVSSTGETCAGLCDGSMTAVVSGGTAPWQLTFDGDAQPIGMSVDQCSGSVEVQVIDDEGCQVSTTVVIAAGSVATDVEVQDHLPVCTSEQAFVLSAAPLGGIWEGVGIIDPVLGVFDPGAAGEGAHVIHYVLDGACVAADSVLITVEGTPSSAFVLPYEVELPFAVFSTSTDQGVLAWTLNGVDFGSEPQLLLTDEDLSEGNSVQDLCLMITTLAGCADTSCVRFMLASPFQVHVPNAFTPNGDGINDTFQPIMAGLRPKEYRLSVFDRWGKVVFATDRPDGSWDGTEYGGQKPVGVFPWRLEWGDAEGTQVRMGHVTLVR